MSLRGVARLLSGVAGSLSAPSTCGMLAGVAGVSGGVGGWRKKNFMLLAGPCLSCVGLLLL